MQFKTPLIQARLIRRYQRFLADVELTTGEMTTVHCPNTGAMLGVADSGQTIWLTPFAHTPQRRCLYRWEITETADSLVGINTQLPNILVAEALAQGKITEFASYTTVRKEVKYGQNCRIDFLLQGPNLPDCYLEVKNVHLKRGDFVEFPDCVTARGVKHLENLSILAQSGMRAVVLYIVQRTDCAGFQIAKDIDPKYAQAFDQARIFNVEQLCYQCHVHPHEIVIDKQLPIIL